jgi:hypothetical protein
MKADDPSGGRRGTVDAGAATPREPPFGADDPDPFMHPLEAAQIVVRASRDEADHDAAAQALEHALADKLLRVIGQQRGGMNRRQPLSPRVWAHHRLDLRAAATSPKGGRSGSAWTDLRFLSREVLALWPPDLLTLDEGCAFLEPRLEEEPADIRRWLLAQLEAGGVERLCATPENGWRCLPVSPAPPSGGGPGAPWPPQPRYWRVRRRQLLEAILDHPAARYPGRTLVPLASEPPWTAHPLARDMVAAASGYGPDGAAGWLKDRARRADPDGSPPAVRARFAPRALAELERTSEREIRRALFPAMILDDLEGAGGQEIGGRPGCCAWYLPSGALASGECPDSGLAVADVEWDGDELRAALAKEFATDAGATASPPAATKPKDREGIGGAPRKYPWDELGAAFGAWLHEEPRRDQQRPSQLLEALADIAERLGREAPNRTTAQPYLNRWLKGYRAFVGDGN